MVAMLVIDFFQGGNGTNGAQSLGGSNGQIQGFHQGFYHQLLIIASFQIGYEDIIRQKRFDILLLVSKGVRLHGVIHIVVNHTPNRSISGTGDCCHDLDGMLAVENIIDATAATDLYGVNLQ